MDATELGQRVKAKYPQYANLTDEEVGQKMMQKYPQYKDASSETGIVSNIKKIGSDVVETAGALGQRLSNIGGVVSKALGEAGTEKTAGQVLENVFGTPIHVAGQVAGGIGDIFGGMAKMAYHGASALPVVGGTVQEAGQLAEKGLQTAFQTQPAQELIKKYQSLPQGVKTYAEDIGNIASAFPAGKGLSIAGKEGMALSKDVGTLAVKGIGKTTEAGVGKNISKALGMTGKQSITSALDIVPKAKDAFKTIYDETKGMTVKDLDGAEKAFEPTRATFGETLQALKASKDSIYKQYSELAKKAGDAGARFSKNDFDSVKTQLQSIIENRTSPYSNKARQILNDIDRIFPEQGDIDFGKIQSLIEDINKDVNPLSNKAAAEVSGSVSRTLRNILDSKIEQQTGEGYQVLRNKYANLKSIENNLINQFKKSARETGSVFPQWVEAFGGLDTLVGIISGNVTGTFRGIGMSVIAKAMRTLRDPETSLKKVFKSLEKETKPQTRIGKFLNASKEFKPQSATIKAIQKTKGLPAGLSIKDVSGGKKGYDSVIEDNLVKEAKKYKSEEEFINAQGRTVDAHAAPGESGISLKDRLDYDGDVTLREELDGHYKQPEDYFHGYTGARMYGYDSFFGKETLHAIKKAKDSGEITIYRAVPKGVKSIDDGDWVYFVKELADEHGKGRLEGKYDILSKNVSIDDIWWDGNDIREWGYDSGQNPVKLTTYSKSQLSSIYKQAHQKAPGKVKENTLLEEAKKYNSAEEFVKAQKQVFHGGSGVEALDKNFKISTPEEKLKFATSGGGFEGLSMSIDKNIAKKYSQNIGGTDKVLERYINPNAKIKKIDLKGGTPDDLDLAELKKQGYDAVQDIGNDAEKEFRALTNNATVSKQQLIDIYNQAKGNVKKIKGIGKTKWKYQQ